MLRSLTKLRCFAAVQSRQVLSPPSSRRLLHHSPPQPLHSASNFRIYRPSFISPPWPLLASHPSPSLVQVRHASSKERKRKPVPPTVSKVKKTKMKSYSSFKSRFRTMNDGNIRRWKEGKLHNAHLKKVKMGEGKKRERDIRVMMPRVERLLRDVKDTTISALARGKYKTHSFEGFGCKTYRDQELP